MALSRRLAAVARAACGNRAAISSSAGTAARVRPMVHMSGSKRKGKRGVIGKPFPVEPARVTAPLTVPEGIARPAYADTGTAPSTAHVLEVLDEGGIADIRAAAGLARDVLAEAGGILQPGMTTDDIDAFVHKAIVAGGAYPAPLNYMGFPKSVCTSVNEVVCHGIPDLRPLEAGDIVSIDVSLYGWGKCGDTCRTFIVPDGEGAEQGEEAVDADSAHLVRAAKACLDAGTAMAVEGANVNLVGDAVWQATREWGVSNVDSMCGHGIGSNMHQAPLVLHCPNNVYTPLQAGMVITVEPMVVQGSGSVTKWADGWTITTVDRGLAAQFEHMLLINPDGAPPDVLTAWEGARHATCPWLPGQG